MQDQQISCKDCGKSFTFTAQDQERYTKKGFNPPKRCPDCRQKRFEQNNRR